MIKEIIYILPLLYILYRSYKSRNLYKLIYVPIIVLSYVGTTKFYLQGGFISQFIILVSIFLFVIALLYFNYQEYKNLKLEILREKREERKREKEILVEDPTRKKKIVVEDLKTHEKKVYWVSPTLGEKPKNNENNIEKNEKG